MSGILAKLFRWNNSKLIVSANGIAEKLLKIIFLLSLTVYRLVRPRSPKRSRMIMIHNFDTDLSLYIDRSRAMGAALYWTGFHEFREFLFLHRFLKPNMVFVDVGANLGEYSLFAAKRLTSGMILSFEPLPSIRSVLEKNIQINRFDNIRVFPFGLSDTNERMTIHEFEDVHEGLATLYPGDRPSKTTVNVELKKLDDIITGSEIKRIDVIKMDIEGGELKALQGSRKLIELYHPVFMIEINEQTYKTAGYTIGNVLQFFEEYHYYPCSIKKRGELERTASLPAFGNIVFMPNENIISHSLVS